MNDDIFKAVSDYPLTVYRCGVRAGDQVRLKHDLPILDSKGYSTGQMHRAGEIWTVLPGAAEIPVVVWLRQSDGEVHTWDDSAEFFAAFENTSV